MPSIPNLPRARAIRVLLAIGVAALVSPQMLSAATLSPGNRNCHPYCDDTLLDSLNSLPSNAGSTIFNPINEVRPESLFDEQDFLGTTDKELPGDLIPNSPVETDVAPIISDD